MSQKKVFVLFGSQTGQAESIATSIHEDCCYKDYQSSLFCLKDEGKLFNITDVHCAIIVCSTTGDGDPPENARKFIRTLNRKTLPPGHLSHLRFALLGLGDTNYSTFAGGPKKLEKALQKCGACSFYVTAFADDGTDLEDVVEPWLDQLWDAVEEHFRKLSSDWEEECNNGVTNHDDLESVVKVNTNKVVELFHDLNLDVGDDGIPGLRRGMMSDVDLNLPPRFPDYLEINFNSSSSSSPQTTTSLYQNGAKFPLANGDIIEATVVSSKQLTSDDAEKRTLEFEIFSEKMFDYQPGDSFGVCCENDTKEVDWLIKRLDLEEVADQVARILINKNTTKKNPSLPPHIPELFTVRQILTSCVEIRSVPKKPLLRCLVDSTSDEEERRRLEELCSRHGNEEYIKFIRSEEVCIIDILACFPSCKPGLSSLIQHLPRITPRRYSASSSPLEDRNKIKFVFNVVRFDSNNSRKFKRRGVCTGFLEDIHDQGSQGRKILIFPLLSSSFHLPEDLSHPIVMVGPGTGVSPFIGFLKHLEKMKAQEGNPQFGKSWLYFGCRERRKDFLFELELEKMRENKILKYLRVSFSREEKSRDGNRKYVQHNLWEDSDVMVDLFLNTEARFYVCGDARNMVKDVRSCFIDMICHVTKCCHDDAVKKFKTVVDEKRYKEDVWT